MIKLQKKVCRLLSENKFDNFTFPTEQTMKSLHFESFYKESTLFRSLPEVKKLNSKIFKKMIACSNFFKFLSEETKQDVLTRIRRSKTLVLQNFCHYVLRICRRAFKMENLKYKKGFYEEGDVIQNKNVDWEFMAQFMNDRSFIRSIKKESKSSPKVKWQTEIKESRTYECPEAVRPFKEVYAEKLAKRILREPERSPEIRERRMSRLQRVEWEMVA